MTTILVIATVAYVIQLLFLRLGMERANRARGDPSYEPMVSIIVAARNEEEYIEQCVISLSKLDYPKEKLQVIIVDDRSTDNTARIVFPYTQQYPFIHLLTTETEQGNLRGKTNAAAMGIRNSSGEILMFTDADCTVPQEWVRQTVRSFDQSAGIVGGFTFLAAKRTFEGMQTLDWIFLFGLASSTAGWKLPLTVIGNNLSVRRSAYNHTGGYEKIPFSVTEDYALVQSIVRQTDFEVRFPANPRAVVTSNPCRTWSQLFRQKQRWGVGGLDMIFRGMVIMSIAWILDIALLIGLVAVPFNVWGIALLCKLFVDIRFLWGPLKRFGKLSYLKYFLAFEVYCSLYALVLPFVAILSKKIVWKERVL